MSAEQRQRRPQNLERTKSTDMGDPRATSDLEADIRNCINRHSRESDSDTPDAILAHFLISCLEAFEVASNRREAFYGRPHDRPEETPMSAEQELPRPGSVWRKGDEWRRYDGPDPVYKDVSYSTFGDAWGACSPAEWLAWAAGAECVSEGDS